MVLTRTVTCLLVFCCLVSAGCGFYRPTRQEIALTDIELAETPFFAQDRYQCGPAALAMVLGDSGVVISPENLVGRIYLPGRKGSLQPEILATIRKQQRIPYVIRPDLAALQNELEAGRPVLVLQDLGLPLLPAYHYAVVIGSQQDGYILLRSGTTRRLRMKSHKFLNSWQKMGNWGVVVLKADESPSDPDPRRYLKALADMEAVNEFATAEQGYRTLLSKYPNQAIARFGLANALLLQNKFSEAAVIFKRLLKDQPGHAAAANNLAETMAGQHCYEQAERFLDAYLQERLIAPRMRPTLTTTLKEIRARAQQSDQNGSNCQVAGKMSNSLSQ